MSSSTAIRFDLPDGAKAKTYAPSVVSVKDSAMEGTTYQDGSSDAEQPLREIAGKESHQVHRLRIVVMLVLLLAAVAVSSAIFLLTKQSEEEEFETEFNGIAAKVLESFTQIVGEKVSAVDSMAVTATSFASANNLSWPFVTLNDFAYRAESVTSLADCLLLELLPIVSDEQRADWEAYSMANEAWFYESLQYQAEHNPVVPGAPEESADQDQSETPWGDNLPFIFEFTAPEPGVIGIQAAPGPGPYAPGKRSIKRCIPLY